jgi:enoyl-[acyl-carrier-protein] reductase (NADH)
MRHSFNQFGTRWLWVPACAGTTSGNASTIRHALFRVDERWKRVTILVAAIAFSTTPALADPIED